MKKILYRSTQLTLLAALGLPTFWPMPVRGQSADYVGVAVAQRETQRQKILAIYLRLHPGERDGGMKVADDFIEHLKVNSPIASEKFASGKMDDDELESRFAVFAKHRSEDATSSQQASAMSPQRRVADLLQTFSSLAANDSERLALADKFLIKLAERSSTASDSLRVGRMPADELKSRVSVFVADLKAEAESGKKDPSIAAIDALVDSYARANLGREGERLSSISYRGQIEENGMVQPFVVFRMRPDKIRMHFISDGHITSVLAYDGYVAWHQSAGTRATLVTAKKAVALIKLARFDPPLLGYRDRGAEISRVDNVTADRLTLRLNERDGTEILTVLDSKTLEEVSTLKRLLDGSETETRYKEYRKVGVLNVPFVQEEWVKEKLKSTMRIVDVRPEPGLLEIFFNKPTGTDFDLMDLMGSMAVIKARDAKQAAVTKASAESKP